jgi:hypothetical protein
VITWVLHILELVAGILGLGVGFSRLPDTNSALAVATPTAVGLVGLLAFFEHFLFPWVLASSAHRPPFSETKILKLTG